METRIKSFNQFVHESVGASAELKYHTDRHFSLAESVFRPGSAAHLQLLNETRELFDSGRIVLEGVDLQLFSETDLGKFGTFEGVRVPLDLVLEADELNEATKKGKQPKLNYPTRGGGKKKYKVYVRDPKTGNIRQISFGDVKGGLTAKVSNPKARKSFAARHNCKEKTDRTSAGYWACRINRYAHLWGGKTYPGFW
jgi:hypothetical protein